MWSKLNNMKKKDNHTKKRIKKEVSKKKNKKSKLKNLKHQLKVDPNLLFMDSDELQMRSTHLCMDSDELQMRSQKYIALEIVVKGNNSKDMKMKDLIEINKKYLSNTYGTMSVDQYKKKKKKKIRKKKKKNNNRKRKKKKKQETKKLSVQEINYIQETGFVKPIQTNMNNNIVLNDDGKVKNNLSSTIDINLEIILGNNSKIDLQELKKSLGINISTNDLSCAIDIVKVVKDETKTSSREIADEKNITFAKSLQRKMNNSTDVRDDCRISVFNLSSTIDVENVIANKQKTCSQDIANEENIIYAKSLQSKMNNSIGVRDDCRISVFNLSSTIDIENIIRNKRKTCSVQAIDDEKNITYAKSLQSKINNSIGVRDDYRISIFNLSSTIDIEKVIIKEQSTNSQDNVDKQNITIAKSLQNKINNKIGVHDDGSISIFDISSTQSIGFEKITGDHSDTDSKIIINKRISLPLSLQSKLNNSVRFVRDYCTISIFDISSTHSMGF